jgi:hypothetical protein
MCFLHNSKAELCAECHSFPCHSQMRPVLLFQRCWNSSAYWDTRESHKLT